MDIHILREGTELGPFTEEVVQTLLQQGSVSITDLSWRPGLDGWIPLANLLYASTVSTGEAPAPIPMPPAEPAPVRGEPASARQKAFLSYLGLPFPPELTKHDAAELVNDAMENPREPARLAAWTEDRLKLHPELFAAEVQALKEGRAQHYLEVCQDQGAEYFSKVTKAHTTVLVGYLDVNFPRWDADARTAAWNYFFPALSEKFPQLLSKEAKGKFKYPEGPKIAAELVPKAPKPGKIKPQRKSPLPALARGVFFGALILVLMWFFKNLRERRQQVAVPTTPVPVSIASTPAPTVPAASEMTIAASSESAPAAPETNPDPAPSTNQDLAPLPERSPATGNGSSLFGPDPKPAPTQITPAPMRANLLLTRPVDVQLTYGRIKLPPGTAVKLLHRDGNMLRVSYLNNTLTIPVASTDLGLDATESATPAESKPPTPAPRQPPNSTKPEIGVPEL